MHFRTALIGLAASCTAVAAQDSTCHDYVIISIRGTYELQGPSIGFPGMINATLNAIPNGIEYDAVYPAAPNQTAYLGSDDVVRYITNGLESCPDQQYAILGYSQGASATMIALTNYTQPGTAGYEAIRAVLVIGNPYHIPNKAVDVDQWGQDSTRKYPGAAYNADNPGSQGIPDIYYSNGKLLDICFQEDIVCAPGYPNATFSPGHLHYGETEVQDLGASFLIPRLGGVYVNMTATSTAKQNPGMNLSPTGTAGMPIGTGMSGTGSGFLPTGSSGVGPTGAPFTGASSSTAVNGLMGLVFGAMTVVAVTAVL
nr:hypothetical protein CFP56_37359 [Quercus suber]